MPPLRQGPDAPARNLRARDRTRSQGNPGRGLCTNRDSPYPRRGPMSPTDPDFARVRSALARDPTGVAWLTEQLRIVPRIVAHMARRSGGWTAHDVEDAAAEALQLAVAGLARYHGLAPFVSWLHKICENTVRGMARRRQLRAMQPLDFDSPDGGPDPATQVTDRETMDNLHRHIDAIGGVEAEVLRLRYLEVLDFSDIAIRLGIPLATIRTRHYRALRKLQQRIAPSEGNHDGESP